MSHCTYQSTLTKLLKAGGLIVRARARVLVGESTETCGLAAANAEPRAGDRCCQTSNSIASDEGDLCHPPAERGLLLLSHLVLLLFLKRQPEGGSESSSRRRRVTEEDGDAEGKGTLRWSLQGGTSTNRRGDGVVRSSAQDVGGVFFLCVCDV